MTAEPKSFIPTRRSLLTRLKRWDDQAGWREFFDTYWRLIHAFALKAGLTETEAQEVVQETVVSVSRKMPGFNYDPALGSFKSWLLLITRRRVADQFRKRPREQPFPSPAADGTQTSAEARVPDPASLDADHVWDQEWQRSMLETALERVKRRVAPRQFQLFEVYVLKQWDVEKIVRTLRVTAGQVYLSKNRVGSLLKKEITKLEAEAPF